MSDEIKKEKEEITTQELNKENVEESVVIEEKLEDEIAETKETEEKKEEKEIKQEENKENIEEEKKEEVQSKKEKKFKLKYLIILAIVLAIVAIGVLGIFSFVNKSNKVGNSIGNIRNYGYATAQGNNIYYVAPGENAEKIAIYKAKKDGSKIETILLKDWEIYGLNIVGEYIYFVAIENNEEVYSEDDTINNKIYRMKKDGSELQVINDNNFYNESYEIYVIKDKVYYMGKDLNVYSMNLDGTNQTVINDDQTGFIGINEEYIILNKAEEKEEGESKIITYCMNLDGSNEKPITGERLYSINIIGNDLYYVDANKHVYKVNLKTGENILISETEAYNMNVTNKYIYFMNYTDESEYVIGIYKMNLDGTEETKLLDLDSYSTFLDIVSERVVYMDSNEEKGVVNLLNPKNSEVSNLFTYNFAKEDEGISPEDTTSADTTN